MHESAFWIDELGRTLTSTLYVLRMLNACDACKICMYINIYKTCTRTINIPIIIHVALTKLYYSIYLIRFRFTEIAWIQRLPARRYLQRRYLKRLTSLYIHRRVIPSTVANNQTLCHPPTRCFVRRKFFRYYLSLIIYIYIYTYRYIVALPRVKFRRVKVRVVREPAITRN